MVMCTHSSIYDVIMLSQNKYEVEKIVDIILTTGSAFKLTARDVVELKNSGLDDSVIQAMLTAVPPLAGTDSAANIDWLNLTLEDLLLLLNNEVSDAVIVSFIRTRKRAFIVGTSEILLPMPWLFRPMVRAVHRPMVGVAKALKYNFWRRSNPPPFFYTKSNSGTLNVL